LLQKRLLARTIIYASKPVLSRPHNFFLKHIKTFGGKEHRAENPSTGPTPTPRLQIHHAHAPPPHTCPQSSSHLPHTHSTPVKLAGEEAKSAGDVLNAAFLTYVASAVSALLTLLYYVWRFSSSRD
jgi:hypothetical protein